MDPSLVRVRRRGTGTFLLVFFIVLILAGSAKLGVAIEVVRRRS